MSKARWSRPSRRTALPVILLLACVFTLSCDDDDEVIATGAGPYSIRFSLAADFQQYGGQTISWALLRSDTGEKLVAGRGTISDTANPPFSVTTGDVMLFGVPHQMHYWIDSNIGGGTEGVCDPVVRDEENGEIIEAFDMQWIAPFGGSTDDLVFIAIHRPELVLDVCDTFPF
jgi:hypothetical protein